MRMARDLRELRDALRHFAVERDWDRFHSPKNLAMALNVEAGELLEHFQWLGDEQSRRVDQDSRQAIAHEMSDVLLYLVQLADKLDVDLLAAATHKMALNAVKYPADKQRGGIRAATEL
jgi:NTP pyrophosphatase (non-canonical NTP hydrolase)